MNDNFLNLTLFKYIFLGVFIDFFFQVIQRRFDGSVDFYRNWTEYENGFGSSQSEIWLGGQDQRKNIVLSNSIIICLFLAKHVVSMITLQDHIIVIYVILLMYVFYTVDKMKVEASFLCQETNILTSLQLLGILS